MSQAATIATMHSQTSCMAFSRMVAGIASAAVKKMPAAYPIGMISSMAAIRIRSSMHRKYTKPPKLANQVRIAMRWRAPAMANGTVQKMASPIHQRRWSLARSASISRKSTESIMGRP